MSDSLQVTGSFGVVPRAVMTKKVREEISVYFSDPPTCSKLFKAGAEPYFGCPWRLHPTRPVVGLVDRDADIRDSFRWLEAICNRLLRDHFVWLTGMLVFSDRDELIETGFIRVKKGRPKLHVLGHRATLRSFDDWFFEYRE